MPSVAASVADAVRCRWPERGDDWLAALPGELEQLCADLDLTPTGRAFPARFAHVLEARTPTGAHLVLRSSPDPQAVHQGAVLERLAHAGLAPTVHLIRHSRTATWIAMDAIHPGRPLAADPVASDVQTELAAVLRALAECADSAPDIPGVVSWLRSRLTAPPAADQPPDRNIASEATRADALRVLDQLSGSAPRNLCHGDFSPSNVLRGTSGLWLVDPRGVTGEAAYDIAVLALKLSHDNVCRAYPLASDLARATGADLDRCAAWVSVAAAATV